MKRSRPGFTLVELLVVITIIGMLVGLLLPAVNMAREAGRRTQCSNNLHQLATSCLAHSQKLGYFPSGGWGSEWVGMPDYGTGVYQPGGWIYQLLPYMDQANLHDLGAGSCTTSGGAAASATRCSMPLPVLYCPTRRAALPYPLGAGAKSLKGSSAGPNSPYYTTNPLTMAGRTDYAINGGSYQITMSSPSSVPVSPTFAWPSLVGKTPATSFNGIACIHSAVTDAMISDAKDLTYLIGEKYMSPQNYITGVDSTPGGTDKGDLYSAMSGDDVSTIRWGNTTLLPSMDRITNPPQTPQTPSEIFGSPHGAGWHASFCDGHVQLIGWNIDPTTHQTLATRNGVQRYGYLPADPSLIPH